MPSRPSPFGRVTLVSGPESLLADRAVAALLEDIRTESPEAEVTRTREERDAALCDAAASGAPKAQIARAAEMSMRGAVMPGANPVSAGSNTSPPSTRKGQPWRNASIASATTACSTSESTRFLRFGFCRPSFTVR